MSENKNIINFLLIIIILILSIPLLLITVATINIDLFSKIGVIGDAIGGMTAPFIGIVSSILVYLSFEQQRKANLMLQIQLDQEKDKEEIRLTQIKELLLFDLKEKIKPKALEIKEEIEDFFKSAQALKSITKLVFHTDFNSDIFNAVNLIDIFMIFKNSENDFNNLCNFYKRVDFIGRNTLGQIVEEYNETHNEEPYIKTLQDLLKNIDTLCFQIDKFIVSYENKATVSV